MTTPIPLPPSIVPVLDGLRWTKQPAGGSGAVVYRLDAPGRPAFYLKHCAGAVAEDLADEAARLEWLRAYIAVPAVRYFVRSSDQAWLLTTALAGRPAGACIAAEPARASEIVTLLAVFLRAFHALPVDACPFDSRDPRRLAEARRNIDAGKVDATDFDATHQGWTPEQVWAEMLKLLPLDFDRCVSHGDFTLGNVLIADGAVTGCIDVGRAGIADPYQDLALITRDLAQFCDSEGDFLRAYGIADPDDRKLRFHYSLDEFF